MGYQVGEGPKALPCHYSSPLYPIQVAGFFEMTMVEFLT
jgi:hypothetical protein